MDLTDLQIRSEHYTKFTLSNNTTLLKDSLLNCFAIFQYHQSRKLNTLMWHIQIQEFINDTTLKHYFIKPWKCFQICFYHADKDRKQLHTTKHIQIIRITVVNNLTTGKNVLHLPNPLPGLVPHRSHCQAS